MNPTIESGGLPSGAPGDEAQLRQMVRLSAALLASRTPADVRRLAVSAGVLIGGGPSVVLAYDPLSPTLRVEESEGLASSSPVDSPGRSKGQTFVFPVRESFVRAFERSASAENPQALEQALRDDLGFQRPVVVPLGAGGKLRGVFAADARGSQLQPSYALRHLGSIVAGALAAAEAEVTFGASPGAVDPVTGLAERNAAEAHLRRELARAKRYHEPLSIVLLDVDRFEGFNEDRGYWAGDRLLKEVGQLLVGHAPDGDGVALCFRESDLAARWGADSFLVLLPSTSQSGAVLAGERFLAGLRRWQSDAGSSAVTATAAVVTFPDDGLEETPLLERAERLVAEAAEAGGDRLVVAPPRNPDWPAV